MKRSGGVLGARLISFFVFFSSSAPAALAFVRFGSPMTKTKAGAGIPAATPLSAAAGTQYSIGIDVGTGSARCGVFSLDGKLMGTASVDITMTQPGDGKQGEFAEFFQQSSSNIWESICKATHTAMSESGVAASDVVGLGFDATCSLVCLDGADAPVGVDPLSPNDSDRNVIVWLDHRATEQASRINALKHDALRTVGGVISPEMEMPKLLWLKENFPDKWVASEDINGASSPSSSSSSGRFSKFFDLADFLVYRATGGEARSLCTTVCKWNYDALDPSQPSKWDRSFLQQVGLDDLTETHIGYSSDVSPVGEPVAKGLSGGAAAELGLAEGTPVGVGMIDAHAGGLGVLGAVVAPYEDEDEDEDEDGGEGADPMDQSLPRSSSSSSSSSGGGGGDEGGVVTAEELEGRMALIAGTSCCHMLSSVEPVFVPGVWGPYYSAMLPGMFLNEGGQSTAGKLLDHVTEGHKAYPELLDRMAKLNIKSPYDALNAFLVEEMAPARNIAPRKVGLLTKDLHVTPDFFGNRSPLADPDMAGAVVGLRLSSGLEDLALLYLATVQALAYQTKHIIESCVEAGHAPITSIFVTGGLVKNPLYLQAHADVTGCPLEVPSEPEAVLLGAAVLGARAGGTFADIPSAMASMNKADAAARVLPYHMECDPDECDISIDSFHGCKYSIFRRMSDDQLAYRGIMECACID